MPESTSSTTSKPTRRDSPSDRRLTLDEAIEIAVVLQQNEQWAAAAEIYRNILEVAPDHADALHFSGVLAHQRERSDQAVALIERSLELEPERADWHSNLGIVLQDRLELDGAIAQYRRAIALDPKHANAHNNLGVVLRAKGRVDDAEAAYRAAIRIDPEHADAYNNLGVLLNGQKRSHEAAVCFSKVITLRPKHPEARRLLALAHCTLGEVDKAVQIFEEWLEAEPDNPIARHMLAACSGRDVPSRASDAYIERTFDSFAASFDSKLAKLEYRAPALVAAMLADTDASKSLDVLDAGCGTGLCGPLVAPYARRLVAAAGWAADLHRRGTERHRVLDQPDRPLPPCARLPRARAGECESSAPHHSRRAAARGRRSRRRVRGERVETDAHRSLNLRVACGVR